jgi:predicted transcriptional regulator
MSDKPDLSAALRRTHVNTHGVATVVARLREAADEIERLRSREAALVSLVERLADKLDRRTESYERSVWDLLAEAREAIR